MAKIYKIVVRLDNELVKKLDAETVGKGIIKSWYIREAIKEKLNKK